MWIMYVTKLSSVTLQWANTLSSHISHESDAHTHSSLKGLQHRSYVVSD